MPRKPKTTETTPEARRLNVRIDPDVHKALRLAAAEQDQSIQSLVEFWLREKLNLPAPPDEGSKGGACFA